MTSRRTVGSCAASTFTLNRADTVAGCLETAPRLRIPFDDCEEKATIHSEGLHFDMPEKALMERLGQYMGVWHHIRLL